MDGLRDAGSPCNMSEFVLHGTHIEAAWAATIAAGRHKERGLGIGPQGLGGTVTALDVFIEEIPCHIASMPLAVNVQCHAQRHKSVEL